MNYDTLMTEIRGPLIEITLNRPDAQNAINIQMLIELNEILDRIEESQEIKMIVIRGQKDYFCKGMDFEEVTKAKQEGRVADKDYSVKLYSKLLNRIASISKVVITCIEGTVMAGGVGIVAASDFAIASYNASFVLTEALWGLVPAMVSPYLIRRIGFQKAYIMTLTANKIDAEEAHMIQLVDEISEKPEVSMRRICRKFRRLDNESIKEVKQFFRKMWIITSKMEDEAANESYRISSKQHVQQNISNFILQNKFPWEQ